MLANHIFLGVIGAPQVIIIIAVALLFFGGRIREFKDAMKDGQEPQQTPEKREGLTREDLKKLEEKNS